MKTFLKLNWPWVVQVLYLPILLYAGSAYAERLVNAELANRNYVTRTEMNQRLDGVNQRLDLIYDQLKKLTDMHMKP